MSAKDCKVTLSIPPFRLLVAVVSLAGRLPISLVWFTAKYRVTYMVEGKPLLPILTVRLQFALFNVVNREEYKTYRKRFVDQHCSSSKEKSDRKSTRHQFLLLP